MGNCWEKIARIEYWHRKLSHQTDFWHKVDVTAIGISLHYFRSSIDMTSLGPLEIYGINTVFDCRFPLPENYAPTCKLLDQFKVKEVIKEICRVVNNSLNRFYTVTSNISSSDRYISLQESAVSTRCSGRWRSIHRWWFLANYNSSFGG